MSTGYIAIDGQGMPWLPIRQKAIMKTNDASFSIISSRRLYVKL